MEAEDERYIMGYLSRLGQAGPEASTMFEKLADMSSGAFITLGPRRAPQSQLWVAVLEELGMTAVASPSLVGTLADRRLS